MSEGPDAKILSQNKCGPERPSNTNEPETAFMVELPPLTLE